MITCSYCNSELFKGDLFCTKCGTNIKTQSIQDASKSDVYLVCKNCGSAINAKDTYCTNCGISVNSNNLTKQKEQESNTSTSLNEIVERTLKERKFITKNAKKSIIYLRVLATLTVLSIVVSVIMYLVSENEDDQFINENWANELIELKTDKDLSNAEFIDNLYRNYKYKFRIKFPKNWILKRADGPHIVIKSVGGLSSINIGVFDYLDLKEFNSSIYNLMTLNEFRENLTDTPGVSIIDTKRTKIDNRDAYYAEIKISYQALEAKVSGNQILVQLVNNNLLYTINGFYIGANYSAEKEVIMSSIRTFVIEEYLTGEPNLEFRLDKIIDK